MVVDRFILLNYALPCFTFTLKRVLGYLKQVFIFNSEYITFGLTENRETTAAAIFQSVGVVSLHLIRSGLLEMPPLLSAAGRDNQVST